MEERKDGRKKRRKKRQQRVDKFKLTDAIVVGVQKLSQGILHSPEVVTAPSNLITLGCASRCFNSSNSARRSFLLASINFSVYKKKRT